MRAGENVSFDGDIGAGWHHLAAVRRGGALDLFVDGKRAATSRPPRAAGCNISNAEPLKIGCGEIVFFQGRIRGVRLYGRALAAGEIGKLAAG
jgi:hypothetical protein